jgi:hypothetical protein
MSFHPFDSEEENYFAELDTFSVLPTNDIEDLLQG